MTARAFAVRVGQTAARLIDWLVMQIQLGASAASAGQPRRFGRSPNDSGNYVAPSYPGERRRRIEEYPRLRGRQSSVRDICRTSAAPDGPKGTAAWVRHHGNECRRFST